MSKDYGNYYLGQAYMQAFGILESALINAPYEKLAILKTFDDFTFEEFVNFGRYWLKSGTIVTFANGNISKEDALKFSQEAKAGLKLREIGLEQVASIRGVQVEPKQVVRIEKEMLNPEDENSASLIFF